jgi:pimeloyl-ACP methyl ester carboxylesterase
MDINRSKPDFSLAVISQGSGTDHCQAASEVTSQKAPCPENMLVTARDSVPSLIPQRSLPQAVPASTRPILLSSPLPIAPVEQETVKLANHVSLDIFSSAQTQNSKNVVVFLHGGPGLAYGESYKPMTEWFPAHGYTLVAPEIAGSGKPGLENMSNSHTQNYVRDLKSVIQCLRERPDMQGKEFCVVAHSWGGFQLASLLTDETAEERKFFNQAVFISPNLDSAQTRLFADASQYSDVSDNSMTAFEHTLVRNFEERHAGNEVEMEESDRMTVINNPLISQPLNEKFSPFYRLEKMPPDIPCLFFHAADDKQVPVSQSVDAFARINSAGGNASLVIASHGGHGFFKTGDGHNAGVMTGCFSAIDTLVKQAEPSKMAVIDGTFLQDNNIETVEEKILEVDKTYENFTKALNDFHNGIEATGTGGERKRIPPKRKLLEKISGAHANIAVKLQANNSAPARRNAEANRQKASLINESLANAEVSRM